MEQVLDGVKFEACGNSDNVLFEMENNDRILISLLPRYAPLTVSNFKKLVVEGFYNGLIFHRVIKGFMIQGGDPTGTGMGGAAQKIKGEFRSNGVLNDLSHTRGVISMARSSMPNSASSQFFICHDDAPHLDGSYAAFGQVIAGMDTIDAIASVRTGPGDRPVIEQKIKSAVFVKLL